LNKIPFLSFIEASNYPG